MFKGVHNEEIFWRQFPLIILKIKEILIEMIMSIKTLTGEGISLELIPFEGRL